MRHFFDSDPQEDGFLKRLLRVHLRLVQLQSYFWFLIGGGIISILFSNSNYMTPLEGFVWGFVSFTLIIPLVWDKNWEFLNSTAGRIGKHRGTLYMLALIAISVLWLIYLLL